MMKTYKVLSLFDGISCARIAFKRAGIDVGTYWSSEIDKNAITVADDNWPQDAQHRLGDISDWRNWDIDWASIDYVVGGSPCQGFSMMGKQLNFEDERSVLFFTFVDIVKHVTQYNKDVKWLLENVRMKREWIDVINEHLGVIGVPFNSRLVSAQNRPRIYWCNFSFIIPEDQDILLKDIVQKKDEIDERYYLKDGRLRWLQSFGTKAEKKCYVAFNPPKAKALMKRSEPSWNTTYVDDGIYTGETFSLQSGTIRKLTPVECERLQTIDDGYTKSVRDLLRYELLGNGWTVDVIAWILLFSVLKHEQKEAA
jgi:DNA-cytosine methyltransferase